MADVGLERAKQAAGGKNSDLAALLNISESAVSQWKRIPYKRAVELEEKTNGAITRYDLRPDVFGAPPAEPLPPKQDAA